MKKSIKKIYRKFKKCMKNLNRTINYIHNKTNAYRVVLFFDIVWSKIRYGSTINEYRIFKFYEINSNKRQTYITNRKYKKLNRLFVDEKITNILNDKELFNRRFKDYLKRKICNINELSFKQIETFLLDNNPIIGKSLNKSFFDSYKVYDLNDFRSPAFLSEQVKEDKLCIIEKKFNQASSLCQIADLVVINVVSVYDNKPEIVSASIKYKDGNKVISGYIDINTSSIKGYFKDEDGNNITNDFDGFVIPKLDKVFKEVKSLSKELSEIKQVEWSYVITTRNAYLVDGNIWEDYVFLQNPDYLDKRIGLMDYYDKFFL